MDLVAAVEEHNEIAPWTRGGLARFLAYCEAGDTSALRAEVTVDFLQTLVARGYSPHTIHIYRSMVNTFFRWLYQQGLLSFDAQSLRQAFIDQAAIIPKASPVRMVAPEEADVRGLLEAAYAALPHAKAGTSRGKQQYLTYLRNIAIVETLRATGIRSTELVLLRRRDLDLENQVACASDGRVLYFDLKSWGALMRYLLARSDPVNRPLLVQQAPVFARHDPPSTSRGMLPLHRMYVWKIIRKLRTTESLTTRSLRRRFGQRLLAATADERGTAELLGLKRVENVRRYGRA